MEGVGAMVGLKASRSSRNIDVLRKSRLTAGFAFLTPLAYNWQVGQSRPVAAGGRTHIKTFSFWSLHPPATVGRGFVSLYALHLDFGRHFVYLDLSFDSYGVEAFARP